MGSHPTLDHQQLAAEARELDPDDGQHHHAVAHPTVEHPQVRAWPDDNPDLAHQLDHRDWSDDHHHRSAERAAEEAFDRLNPDFGVPADQHNPCGRQAVRDREAALALGVRVAVHDSRQNDPNPVIWQAGQDYRAATPSTPPAGSPPAPGTGASGPAPNAERTHEGAHRAWQRTTRPPSPATSSTPPSCASPTPASP